MTGKELAVPQPQQVQAWSREDVDLIKNTVARGATDHELKLFLTVAKRSGLDPFSKQIHFVKRKIWNSAKKGYDEVGTIQTGIDGYRAIGEQTGTLAGIDDAVFDDESGTHPQKASVTVYRFLTGQRVAFTASARWSEYAATDREGNPAAMWKKMPYLMLAKCAEALALRKAFPNDLSGLYTSEEMQQADRPTLAGEGYDTSAVAEDVEVISTGDDLPTETADMTPAEQKKHIAAILKFHKVDFADKKAAERYVADETLLSLKPENYAEIIRILEANDLKHESA
jgi:phage recombination protein Bet